MSFYCYRCDKEFNSSKETIIHLKKSHFVVDKCEPIKCIVRNCSKTFSSFNTLSRHLKAYDHRPLENVGFK